jgi:hypothetical protein
MLPPEAFGNYLAVGTKKQSRGQAIFFSLGDLGNTPFNLKDLDTKCRPHPDGEPKHTVYLAIYRVLEQIPISAIQNLYLVTPDGRVLEIKQTTALPKFRQNFHLYQEICPVHPRIASTLDPHEFVRYITNPENAIHVPKICFADLKLGYLGENPEQGGIKDLPYTQIEHLRTCLIELHKHPEKKETKTVDRIHPPVFPYRTIENGIFVGGGNELLYYRFPAKEELMTTYYEWWRSATLMSDVETEI